MAAEPEAELLFMLLVLDNPIEMMDPDKEGLYASGL